MENNRKLLIKLKENNSTIVRDVKSILTIYLLIHVVQFLTSFNLK